MGNHLGTADIYNPRDGNVYQQTLGEILADVSPKVCPNGRVYNRNKPAKDCVSPRLNKNLKRACCLSMGGGSINDNLKLKLLGLDGKVYYKNIRFYDGPDSLEQEKEMCKEQGNSFYAGPWDNDKERDSMARNRCDTFYKSFCEDQVKLNSRKQTTANRKPTEITNFSIKNGNSVADATEWTFKTSSGNKRFKRMYREIHQNIEDCNCINSPFGVYFIPEDKQTAAHPQVFDSKVCGIGGAYRLKQPDWDVIPSLQICQQAINITDSQIGQANLEKINLSCKQFSEGGGSGSSGGSSGSGSSTDTKTDDKFDASIEPSNPISDTISPSITVIDPETGESKVKVGVIIGAIIGAIIGLSSGNIIFARIVFAIIGALLGAFIGSLIK